MDLGRGVTTSPPRKRMEGDHPENNTLEQHQTQSTKKRKQLKHPVLKDWGENNGGNGAGNQPSIPPPTQPPPPPPPAPPNIPYKQRPETNPPPNDGHPTVEDDRNEKEDDQNTTMVNKDPGGEKEQNDKDRRDPDFDPESGNRST